MLSRMIAHGQLLVVKTLIIHGQCSIFMSKEGRSSVAAGRVAKLKAIALSENNTFSERMRAIDLLGELGEAAYDTLADIAAKGYTYSERMNALDMLERIVRAKD